MAIDKPREIETLEDVITAVNDSRISQIDLAKRVGISPSAMSQICTGKIKSPTHRVALNLIESARALVKQNSKAKATSK